MFFTLFAYYFYLRAKQIPPSEASAKKRSYILSAVSFGLMLASKYFPHYYGLNALYHHLFHVRQPQPGEPSGKTPNLFYILIIVVFLVANPAVLLPQVWSYLNAYMGGQLLVHTGYLFGDQLYKNNMSSTPFWGTPPYFFTDYGDKDSDCSAESSCSDDWAAERSHPDLSLLSFLFGCSSL